jgi:hypothetical protein
MNERTMVENREIPEVSPFFLIFKMPCPDPIASATPGTL